MSVILTRETMGPTCRPETSGSTSIPTSTTTTLPRTNYLAGGIWVYIPDDGDEGDYEFGAFADGAAPYRADQNCRS